jgi:tryptophan halogenase
MKLESIIIVGGGSAGWMTAATLIKTYPKKSITLIENPNSPTVGVGESTIYTIKNFID